MGFLPYMDIKPISSKDAGNGYTKYFFSKDDIKCYDGAQANVSVSLGSSNNVMFFMEGGGAAWPGYTLAVEMDYIWDLGYKNRKDENPLKDWNFVYVPYCDLSIQAGDSTIEEDGKTVYHQGLRHVAAAVAIMKSLFPNPDKILVTGASAGAFGTYVGWPVVKSQFMNTKTYIMGDSGVGFFNPNVPETWQLIKKSWNLHIPDDCTLCNGVVQTWLYDVYLRYDPQLRIGMFSSYRDVIISTWFLGMDQGEFQDLLMNVTDQIKDLHQDRYSRFFIKGESHTCYQMILPQGPNYEVNGVSLYQWIGRLVADDPQWVDELE